MTEGCRLRPASLADAAAILEIYRPYVERTTVTFEYETPSISAFTERMKGILEAGFPYLVCERAGAVVGYAYASRQKARAAYQWNAELSIYIPEERQRDGIGAALYQALIALLRAQGYCNVYGVITHPNEKSERFHQKLGFTVSGINHRTGWKFGQWLDVAEMELRIAEPQGEPMPPRAVAQLDPAFVRAVLAGEVDD